MAQFEKPSPFAASTWISTESALLQGLTRFVRATGIAEQDAIPHYTLRDFRRVICGYGSQSLDSAKSGSLLRRPLSAHIHNCRPIDRSNALNLGSPRSPSKRGSTPKNATRGERSWTAALSSSNALALSPSPRRAIARS